MSKDEWIPVSERIPEEGVWVLACGKKGGMWLGMLTDGCWRMQGMGATLRKPIAWMPLPEPMR